MCGACVPATEETAPRGAIAFKTQASPAARGEPFLTSDGWTVHLDVFAVAARFYVRSEQMEQATVWLFQPAHPIEPLIPGMPAGPVEAQVSVWTIPLPIAGFRQTGRLDPGVAERFTRPTGAAPARGTPRSPGAYLKGRAERAGRVVTFDVAVEGWVERGFDDVVTVSADTIAPCGVLVKPESLFTNASGKVVFDDLAAVDRDGDGVLTMPELQAPRMPPGSGTGIDYGMLWDIYQRFKGLFVVNSE
jgi:hypothetical protein